MYFNEKQYLNTDMRNFREGDTFYLNGSMYRVHYALPPENLIDKCPQEDKIPLFVVSFKTQDGRTLYQVMKKGDWEGCCPVGASTIEAIALELMRMVQIESLD